jgi:hypothetical protein
MIYTPVSNKRLKTLLMCGFFIIDLKSVSKISDIKTVKTFANLAHTAGY